MDFSGLLGGFGQDAQMPSASGILGGFRQNAQSMGNNPMYQMGMGLMNGRNPQAGMMNALAAMRRRRMLQPNLDGGLLGRLMPQQNGSY